MTDFEKELSALINRHCLENESNTPDFILANFLKNCMVIFNHATQKRDNWYGGKRSILPEERHEKWPDWHPATKIID